MTPEKQAALIEARAADKAYEQAAQQLLGQRDHLDKMLARNARDRQTAQMTIINILQEEQDVAATIPGQIS